MSEQRLAKVGEVVIYCDERGVDHNALPTVVWGPQCLNLVFVSSDENRTDGFGRQIERRSSCCHKSMVQAHGNYWRFADEERNAYHAPIE